MKISVPVGTYIIAVSGGVDSMVLLDTLKDNPKLRLIVAHFDHGIREDSKKDRDLVATAAKEYGLKYEEECGLLGSLASEEKAREARYNFLKKVKNKYKADSIITAHHQDDLIETAFINLLRGTGSRGLVSMQSNPDILRPLLKVSKAELIDYAVQNKLIWREDSTNTDEKYLRNYIRKNVTLLLSSNQKHNIVQNIEKIAKISPEKEQLIATISQKIVKDDEITRSKYMILPPEIRSELIMYWLRSFGIKDYDKKTVASTDIYLKTGRAGARFPIKKELVLFLQANTARFELQT